MMDGHHDPEAAFRRAGAREERFTPPPPPRGKTFGRLHVLTLDDAANAPVRNYLLRGLIAPRELSLWWGAPKCGKSFLLLCLAYRLALGLGMWGRAAKRIRVLYVAAEGEGGFAVRLLALRDALGDAGEAFRYIAQRATVGPPSEDLADIIAAALDMRADFIVLDTLARTFGEGDESVTRDMSGFVASVDKLREGTGAHVAVIHHGTKEGGSSRGSGALMGAADLIVKVSKGAEGEPNAAKVEGAKDDADGDVLPFRLRLVDLAPGPDGEPRRTCIAAEADSEADTARRKPLPKQTRDYLTALANIILEHGEPLPAGEMMPTRTKGVQEDAWRAECDARRLSMAKTEKDRDRVFRRAAADLRDAGEIGMRDGWVWLVRTGEAPSDA